ncbi:MAG: hypothetical protein ACR2OC_09460 [Solirubrobacterales bacterium]
MEAIEGLRRTEAMLREYAQSRGLVLRSESPWPGYVPVEQQQGPIRHAIWSLAGRLPGGAPGRLRHQAAFGSTLGIEVAQQHTIMVCRLPESVAYIPMLCVRPDELGMGLYYWGGDQRPRESARFESAELDRRYIVDIVKGQDQNWLYQLFAPTMIDWLAHETPPDFGFKLSSGVFTCECPQWRGQGRMDGELDPEHLDLLAECGGRSASRIRDEVLEEIAGTMPADGPSAVAHEEWANKPQHGRIVGLLMKFVGGKDDSVRDFAKKHDMEYEPAAEFHTRHIALPFPGTAGEVATGTLPGTSSHGSIAWIEYSSDVDVQRNYVAVVIAAAGGVESGLSGVNWVDAEDVGIAGFGENLPPQVLEIVRAAGLGISTGGGSVCVYAKGANSSSWPSGAEVEALCPRSVELAALLDRTSG